MADYREPPHIIIFRRWYKQLIHSINVPGVTASLMSANCMTVRDLERINIKCANTGQIAASETLMTDVMLRNPDPDCFKHFTEALESSNHQYVAEQMRSEYQQYLDYETKMAQGPATGLGAVGTRTAWTNMEQDQRQILYPPDEQLFPDAAITKCIPFVKVADLKMDFNDRLMRGSYGTVIRGTLNGTSVAVKEVKVNAIKRTKTKTWTELYEEQVNREFHVSAFVRHMNVAFLLAYALQNDTLFLVYELIDGHTMEQVILDPQVQPMYHLDKKEKLFLTTQIAQALAFLHHCNPRVVHGDINPANIMVTRDKNLAMLFDLGVNKLKERNAVTTTGGNLSPGTPMYMAREQLLENMKSTTCTDIWSMGASLYEIFFEEDVWEVDGGDTMKGIKKLLLANERPKLIKAPKEGCHNLARLIDKCMQTLDTSRPPALEVLKELWFIEKTYDDAQKQKNADYKP